MALEITYWGGAINGVPIPSHAILSETRSASGSSAQSGAAPPGSMLVSIYCTTEADRFAIGADPTASATSAYIGVGERIWAGIIPGYKVASITA